MAQCIETQGFLDNLNNVYASYGLKSHSGLDISCGYGTEIESPLDGFIYKIIDDKRPANDGTGYWAIFMIGMYKGQLGEFCVGHCSRIDVEIGSYVKKGQILGLEGNKGLVFFNGKQITKEMQDSGDIRGYHRHYQWRLIKKVKTSTGKVPRLTAYPLSIYKDKEGYQYEIPTYYDGHHGLLPVIKDILDDYNLEKKVIEIIHDTNPENVIPITNAEIGVKIQEAERTYFQIALSWASMQLRQLLSKLKR